jgi:predicted membrane protein
VDRLTPSSRAIEATLLPGWLRRSRARLLRAALGILLAVRARRGRWQVRALAEMWLGVLLILGIDFVLVGLVCAIVFVATTGLGRWQDRRQARRFAEAAARGDFEEAESVVRAAAH